MTDQHSLCNDTLLNNRQSDEYYQRSTEDADMMEEYSEKPSAPIKVPFYKKKKYWIICSILTVITIITAVLLAIYVFFPMIAQNIMNAAKIDVNAAQITFTKPEVLNSKTYSKRNSDNMNATFYMNMESSLSKTGPFYANIHFQNPINVIYKDQILGNIYLFNDTSISQGKGTLNAITPFLIKDEVAFASFARDMMAVESFEWTLRGKIDITALTRTATINLDKKITLNGMNGFPNVRIESFQLPGDNPNGGIFVELGTILESPSPIGVQLGTITLAIGYDGINIGTVKADDINLAKGDNHILLKGTLVPQSNPTALDKIGNLFSYYISGQVSNTSAVGISAAPDGANPIRWLSEGFKSVKLNVALAAAEPLRIIDAVQMGYLNLKFDYANPYEPLANAPSVNANFKIPFGFSLNITEVTQNITLAVNTSGTETTDFAMIHVPNVAAISDQKSGTLKFALNNDAIAAIPERESFFNEYIYSLTASSNYTFMVSGNASTKTSTPIGLITLGGISFSVPTTLRGLQFLNSSATIINSLDVYGGTTENLLLDINVTINNPSDFGINTGDVSFVMDSSGIDLGIVTLSNLTLARGENTVAATATFNPNASDIGRNLLSTFLMGNDNVIAISGYKNSTDISSLEEALSALNLDTTLPGLKSALIQGGSMVVLPETVTSGTVGVKVLISNPFSSGLTITKVTAAATFSGMPVGNIDQDISSNPYVIPGKSTAESQNLDMSLNIDPASIALLLRTLAVKANMETRSLDALLGLGGFKIIGMESVSPDSSMFTNFNISSYVMEAMKALKVDLSLTSGLTIGQYQQDLSFSQGSVAIATDSSVTSLIPIVGQPIVQQIVDGAVLGFESIIISAPTDSGFAVQMKGSITKSGPIDAIISFPTPLTVTWQGETLGNVTMADISAKADVGASFDVCGNFVLANADYMASFAAYMINNKDFVWDIVTKDVSVNALGFIFTHISMEKFVTLSGAQGFKDAVKINSFNLPSNDPAGGITLTAETSIKNPSQIGFSFTGVGFETVYENVDLGPLASNGAVLFPPQGNAAISMKGRLISQESASGLAAINEVFNNYLGGNDSSVEVKGISASGPNGAVGWLSVAFKTLIIEKVILPGPKVRPELIPAVTLKDMSLDFTKDPWAPPASSSNVQAQIKSPFGFPLGVSKFDMQVKATYKGSGVATLNIPAEKSTTSSTGLVSTQFSNVPFTVIDQTLFSGFVQLLTLSPSITFGLEGTTNAIAQTAVGDINLSNIGFNVDTSLAGFADFGGKATILSVKISGGTSEYILINLTFSLDNPSNITITIGDINFDTVLNEFNSVIGSVYLKNVVIPPGSKVYSAQMHLGEKVTDTKGISQVLSDYLTATTVPVTIVGTEKSTDIAPLVPILSAVKLATSMTGIQANIITGIAVKGNIIGLILKNKATSQITLQNPMSTSYTIKSVKASVVFKPSSGATPFTVGSINYDLPSPAVVPAGGSIKTDDLPVTIEGSGPTHLIQLLGMLLDKEKYFDVQQNVTVIVGGAYNSEMYYYQDRVPFTLSIDNLPPIGINPSSISAQSLPSNLTSITDPDEFQKILWRFLSGKSPSSSSSYITSDAASTASSFVSSFIFTSTSTTSGFVSTSATTPTTTNIIENSKTVVITESSKTDKETIRETITTFQEETATNTPSEAKATAKASDKAWFSLPF